MDRMVVDNFKLIYEILALYEGLTEDNFFFCEIIRRKKDFIGRPEYDTIKSQRCLKTFYIRNSEHLHKKEAEIISLANFYEARVYINISPSSWRNCSADMLQELVKFFKNDSYSGLRSATDSVVGKAENRDRRYPKTWVIDYDSKDNVVETKEQIHKMGGVIMWTIPTVNGYHFITNPFDLRNNVGFEVHKYNPTLLYYNNVYSVG